MCFGQRTSPIGLDIGSRQVKAVQLKRAGPNRWTLAAATAVPRAGEGAFDAAEALRLAGVLQRQGFAGRRVVVGLPEERAMVSMLELPPRGADVPFEQIARMELARVHQCEPSSFEFAQWQVPQPARAARATSVMAVACAHETAAGYLDALEAAELVVEAIDLESCAAARAVRPLIAAAGEEQDGMCAVLDVGHSAARLAILHQQTTVYSRVIADGGTERLCRSLAAQLQLDLEAALALLSGWAAKQAGEAVDEDVRAAVGSHFDEVLRELNVSFSYALQQYPDAHVGRLVLVGGGAELPGLKDQLESMLGTTVLVARPADLLPCPAPTPGAGGGAAAAAASPAMVTAVGLAQHEGVRGS